MMEDSGNIAMMEDSGNTAVMDDIGNTAVMEDSGNTAVIDDSGNTAIMDDSESTAVIEDSGNTAIMDDSENTAVMEESGITAVIDDSGNTAVMGDSVNTAVMDHSENTAMIEDSGDTAMMDNSGNRAMMDDSINTAVMDDSVRREPLIVYPPPPLIVCPTEAELQAEPTVNVPCTVEGCNKIFNTTAARSVHIIQTHKIYKDEDERRRFDRSQQKSMAKVIKHFYCPVKMCNRSIGWDKPFSRLSLLKQHYYILHAEKKYPCQKCDKRFSTQSQHASHERDCGKEFFCTCGEKHNSMTALYMHAKRKQHALPDQYRYNKRKKTEPVKETYVLILPVPRGNSAAIQKTIRQPTTLLPHPSSCTFIPISGTARIPATATLRHGTATIGVGSQVKTESRTSATTATQTDESRVTVLPPKQSTSSSFAQTALSCFPSFIPMTDAPRRHKKTLAVQTLANWTLGQLPGKMASTETQTLEGMGNASQGQTSLSLQSAGPAGLPPPEHSVSGPFFPQFPNPVSSSVPQKTSFNTLATSEPNSIMDNCGVSTAHGSQLVPLNSQLDSNGSQTPWNVVTVGTNQSLDSARPPVNLRNNMFPPNEALTQTDLTFQNFPEYSTSETQTLSQVNDAMTDTNENSATQAAEVRTGSPPVGPSVPSNATSMSPAGVGLGVETTTTTSLSPAILGVGIQTSVPSMFPARLGFGIQSNSTSMSSEPLCAGVQTSAACVNPAPMDMNIRTNATSEPPAPVNIGDQNSDISMPLASQGPANMPSAPDMAMSGLHLLFLASTEHRANSSLGLPRMDELPCCQQTQTGFDTDTGHQETQTAWDWSLDDFSFLDQHTQTAMTTSNSTSSTTTMPETDQFCQTGIDLYSPFTFSNTETQTASVFDLEMFGTSISVQTEAGSESKLLGEDGLSDISKQVQVSNMGAQQERVCADVQTEDMDFNSLRSRQMGSGQLASSHTQTTLWEDIESMIRSDNFTQTQFP